MRTQQLLLWLLAFITTINALTIPTSFESFTEASQALFKRKGGGGRGGGSSSGSGSSSSGSGSSSSGSGSGSSGSGSSGSTGSSGGSRGSSGGSTSTGSGVPRTYGGAYGGGATVPYQAGSRSIGGITPYLLTGAALGSLSGLWLYGAYAYPYSHPYTYRNYTNNNQTETHPATCLCGQYQECGCDDNDSQDYINSVANNQSISKLANVNGTQTLVINGTLENGTTAPGGSAGTGRQSMIDNAGYLLMVAGVVYSVTLM